jgi:hypothetical protein
MGKIPYKEGADFPKLPSKTPILCKIVESEFVEDEENPWFGKPTGKYDKDGEPIIDTKEFRNVVHVIFSCIEDDYAGSKIWFNATASINEKSKLRPLIEAAAFDHDPTKEELEDYDTDDLVGQYVYVTGSFGPKDTEKKFLRPTDFMRYAAQFKPGFKRPTGNEPKPEAVDDDDGEGEDEEAKLLRQLEAARAKKAATSDEKPARKQSTREKAQKAASKKPAEVEDPEAAF